VAWPAATAVLVLLAAVPAAAQEGSEPTASTYTPPRTPDGQPDIQGYYNGTDTTSIEPTGFMGYGESASGVRTGAYDGFWGADRPSSAQVWLTPGATAPTKAGGAPAAPAAAANNAPQRRPSRTDSPDGSIPFQPWARAKKIEYIKGQVGDPRGAASIDVLDPILRCLPAAPPRGTIGVYAYNGVQFLQPPGHVVIVTEWNHQARIIPLDGRPHLSKNVKLWTGDSRGRWEGNTLVVDVTNTNGRSWMDQTGSFYSDALHVVERFTIVDKDRMQYEATIEDSNVYTRPWKFYATFNRAEQSDYELFEYACAEGNRAVDNALIKDK
jgi:hypothetical protein